MIYEKQNSVRYSKTNFFFPKFFYIKITVTLHSLLGLKKSESELRFLYFFFFGGGEETPIPPEISGV